MTECWGENNAIWTVVTRTVVDAERGYTDPGSVATCPAVIRTVPYRYNYLTLLHGEDLKSSL